MKGKYLIYLVLFISFSYISIMYPSKLLYPFYLIKEIVYLPVKALNNQDISFSCEFKDSIINNLNEEIDSLKKLNNISLFLYY